MRKLLNVLYVTSENAYAMLDGENVVIKEKDNTLGRFPLHILEGIYIFSYAGASPALIGKCVEKNIDMVFCTPRGYFLARPTGRTQGNVLLRREQYKIADMEKLKTEISKNFILGKIVNEKNVLSRMIRDHENRINKTDFEDAITILKNMIDEVQRADNVESIRGYEGVAASAYFSRFNDMILRNEEDFAFNGRNRRPPLDNINALLSFVYMMLTSMCCSALETVGLDPFVGFMHTDRAGRKSLALDLIEELRPCLADRFVLSLINNGVVNGNMFEKQDSGAVIISENGRKKIQQAWQNKKQEKITHPYLKEKIEWGVLPYAQAMLLARFVRGDLEGYPAFIWR
ncbi:type I-C CRISPR-associated endonuclease Cas1c [Lachnobacterium bovis]|uniref:CRISPR-associated endonuclease Cas1 n=1 Tax=Lachnobacterium bovis DSM 14045 TaxID=1122142 RepID=A0A1H3MQX9_9FIRM|nr:type I-C CRISPR-associated endonuclease Cas1c [Lachnobacterium bovis]SDY78479.1 CRISP-associated protein Cas1 [Lachnobacterium bovis DSM 14045]